MPKPKQGNKSTDTRSRDLGTITFSTRLTEEQRDRVVDAAEIRSWSPSNLIRVAALEKAAHILNTSRQTRFDFRRLASKLAKQLMNPEVHFNADDQVSEDMAYDSFVNAGGDVEKLTLADVSELRIACRLGGAELLNMIIAACETLMEPDRKDLPEPIDPVSS